MQVAVHIAGKSHHLIGYKNIGYAERKMFECRVHYNAVLARNCRIQRTISNHNFSTLMRKISIDVLLTFLSRKPGSSQSHITDTLPFISQFIDTCFRR